MAETCVCSHDYWDHEHSIDDLGEVGGDEETRIEGKCHGDFGGCPCEEFTYLGEEEENG